MRDKQSRVLLNLISEGWRCVFRFLLKWFQVSPLTLAVLMIFSLLAVFERKFLIFHYAVALGGLTVAQRSNKLGNVSWPSPYQKHITFSPRLHSRYATASLIAPLLTAFSIRRRIKQCNEYRMQMITISVSERWYPSYWTRSASPTWPDVTPVSHHAAHI